MVSRKEKVAMEKFKAEEQNYYDRLYINLLRYLGIFFIVLATVILIKEALVFSLPILAMHVIGLVLFVGSLLWDFRDRRSVEHAEREEEDLDDLEYAGKRVENYSQNN
ncbi:hypothetical protein JXB02_00790 [Candidatus Woesearchaeota archaeon]|nr:hypothetical protein [Candidatus Woesearchaeota archaeon]